MCYYYQRVQHFTPVCSTTIRFRVTGHFETSTPNNPNWNHITLHVNENMLHVNETTKKMAKKSKI